MKILKSFGRLAAVLGVLFSLAVLSARADDLWTISNIAVDATGSSPSTAKDAALAQGRQAAWIVLFHRLPPATEWPRQPQLTPDELDQLVKSFDIANERHSSTRYLATVTYIFNAASVRVALKKYGMQYSESTAKAVLVVPLMANAWAPESPWAQGWAATARSGHLVPIVVPVGDVAEMSLLSTVATAPDWNAVKALADRYSAATVLIASAVRNGGALQVTLTQIKPDGRSQHSAAYQPQNHEDELALSTRASAMIADSVQEDWKRSTSVDYGAQTSLAANVSFSSLADWIAVRRDLDSVRLVQNILVEEINLQSARLRFDYVGKIDQLQTALAQANLYLTPDANGTWNLSRSAAPAPSPAPAAVP